MRMLIAAVTMEIGIFYLLRMRRQPHSTAVHQLSGWIKVWFIYSIVWLSGLPRNQDVQIIEILLYAYGSGILIQECQVYIKFGTQNILWIQ